MDLAKKIQSPTPASVGLRRITYDDSTLHRSRSPLVGRRSPSKSVYPLPISP